MLVCLGVWRGRGSTNSQRLKADAEICTDACADFRFGQCQDQKLEKFGAEVSHVAVREEEVALQKLINPEL